MTENEKQLFEEAIKATRSTTDALIEENKKNKTLRTANVALLIICVLLSMCLVIFACYSQTAMQKAIENSQEAFNNAMIEALNTVSKMEVIEETTTTMQTVEGNSATINNVHGEQYNDNMQGRGGGE